MSTSSGTIVAVVTDTHIGSTTAVAPPRFSIHVGRGKETQIVIPNKIQYWLLGCWGDFWSYVLSLAGVRGKFRKHRLVIIHVGDVIDGLHHNTPQVMNEIDDQLNAAYDLMRPVVYRSDDSYLVYGTGAHNGGNAQHEIEFANELGMKHGYDFSPLVLDNLSFDITHHGRAGKKDWTSSAASMAAEVALEYVRYGMMPPRYVLRGHNHTIDDSGLKLPYTRAISLPSWQLKTDFAYRVAANKRMVDIGGMIFDTTEPDRPIDCKLRYALPIGL